MASEQSFHWARRLNPVLRGWCNYFRHGVSARTLGYVDHFAFWDRRLAAQTTRPAEHAHPGSAPSSRLEDPRRERRDVPAQRGRHRALPLPGRTHPDTMDEPNTNSGMTTWRTGCSGTGTSGSGGGPQKRTSRKTGTALRPDLTPTGRAARMTPTSTDTCQHLQAGHSAASPATAGAPQPVTPTAPSRRATMSPDGDRSPGTCQCLLGHRRRRKRAQYRRRQDGSMAVHASERPPPQLDPDLR